MDHTRKDTAKCNKCGGPMKWIELKSGKWNPVDPVLIVIQKDEEGQGVLLVHSDGTMTRNPKRGETGYQSHFSTCPYAENFRK